MSEKTKKEDDSIEFEELEKEQTAPAEPKPRKAKVADKEQLAKIEEETLPQTTKDLANSIHRASTLDEKRMAAVQMIQSGLLPNTLATIDQLDDPETREKAIGGVIAIIEYGREINITPWIALNGMHVVQGKVVMGIHMYMGLALKNNILVDIIEDYKKVYSATDKTKLVDIQTTVEITRKHAEFGGLVKVYKFSKRWSEITKAGLDGRDNYKKRPILMLRTRCITEALRLYAADIFMGTYETSEMIDVTDSSYTLDDDGNVLSRG
jgi:hypothetical protein